ncbi:hypothetical protein TNCV_4063421 [Trichonephila clavipes]|nr:hypothetical protein TNCV_4063421 [Trichonephila clavipes]
MTRVRVTVGPLYEEVAKSRRKVCYLENSSYRVWCQEWGFMPITRAMDEQLNALLEGINALKSGQEDTKERMKKGQQEMQKSLEDMQKSQEETKN